MQTEDEVCLGIYISSHTKIIKLGVGKLLWSDTTLLATFSSTDLLANSLIDEAQPLLSLIDEAYSVLFKLRV